MATALASAEKVPRAAAIANPSAISRKGRAANAGKRSLRWRRLDARHGFRPLLLQCGGQGTLGNHAQARHEPDLEPEVGRACLPKCLDKTRRTQAPASAHRKLSARVGRCRTRERRQLEGGNAELDAITRSKIVCGLYVLARGRARTPYAERRQGPGRASRDSPSGSENGAFGAQARLSAACDHRRATHVITVRPPPDLDFDRPPIVFVGMEAHSRRRSRHSSPASPASRRCWNAIT